MNILVLRHSAEKVKNEGKRDIITASQLEDATGYALNKNQIASIKEKDSAYILDRDNGLAFLGEIVSISERLVKRKDGNLERRQDIALRNVQASLFIDVPFIKGWETQRGVKVMSKIEFDKAFINSNTDHDR
ncbi:hypothetical protein [Photobacterium phosphoreum]|uniref:hypothetical protein n=1 Tax=Photobacterium phosphoreum TaxID=659 RepID=UPI001E5DCF1D|nr:hypothetical protein [Photobacterium phosphoreum]MCD9518334.1 hypothetical protein [Photobacterium phosphoreum]